MAVMVKRLLTPRRRTFTACALLLGTVAFIPVVIFVVDQLASPPLFVDVDVQVVVIEEHHEGN